MILIADSGSTKTDWCLATEKTIVKRIKTEGINPYFQHEEEIATTLRTSLLPQLAGTKAERICFYGAGCTPDKASIVRNALSSLLTCQEIRVESDLLAAAHALCGHQPGIACILGTGSNSCFYDGQHIKANVSPLGFILGDEGSGASLGKLLIGNLLKNQLPAGMKEEFLEEYRLTPSEIVERVYRKPFPNRFLAAFSPFLARHLKEPGIQQLILESFKAFLQRNVMQYDYRHHPAHFTGSIAYFYQELLQQAAEECGVRIGTITRSPIEGLAAYL